MKPKEYTDQQLAAELLEPTPHMWAVAEAARRLPVIALERDELRSALSQADEYNCYDYLYDLEYENEKLLLGDTFDRHG